MDNGKERNEEDEDRFFSNIGRMRRISKLRNSTVKIKILMKVTM